MFVQAASEARISDEYGGEFRRLYPWPNIVDTPWGSAWMVITPGTGSTPHSHDENETFIILSGRGEMTVNDEVRVVEKGDVVYLPPFSRHTLRNLSEIKNLEMLCIWWGGQSVVAQ